jgi:transposase
VIGCHHLFKSRSTHGGLQATLTAAVLYTLIQSARLGGVDPQAWLADVLTRIADHPARRLDELLPWNWRKSQGVLSQAA